MRWFQLALLSVTFFLSFNLLHSQVEVETDNAVRVGATLGGSAYLKVRSKNKQRGLYLYNTYNGYTGSTRYGIYNRVVPSNTSGSYYGTYSHMGNGSISPNKKYATYNIIAGSVASSVFGTYSRIYNHDKTAYGSYTDIYTSGTSSYGVYNRLRANLTSSKYGVKNQMTGSASRSYGIENYVNVNSTSHTYGVRNSVFQFNTNTVYGVNNNVYASATGTEPTYGFYNYMFDRNNNNTYGTFNYVVPEATVTSGSKYGSYNLFASYLNGSPANVYGVYADISDFNGYAGYFKGEVYSTVGFTTGSDEKLKENVKNLTKNLEKLVKLKPKKYDLKGGKKDKKLKGHYGFIAQEVKEQFPELVVLVEQPGEEKRVLVSPAHEEQLSDSITVTIPAEYRYEKEMDGEPLLALRYQGFIPILVGAMQEQQEEIDKIKKNKNNQISEEYDDRLLFLEKQLLKAQDELAISNDRYEDLVNHIETLLKCSDCSGLKDVEDQGLIEFDDQFRLYPNPASGRITIEAMNQYTKGFEITITDSSGRKIATHTLTDIITPVDVSALTSGLYNVSIIKDGQVVTTESVMIAN